MLNVFKKPSGNAFKIKGKFQGKKVLTHNKSKSNIQKTGTCSALQNHHNNVQNLRHSCGVLLKQ